MDRDVRANGQDGRASRRRGRRFALPRLDVSGLIAVAALLAAADFALSRTIAVAAAFTLVQVVLLVPWVGMLLRLERSERRLDAAERGRRRRMLAAHAISIGLLAASHVAKAIVLQEAVSKGMVPLLDAYRVYVAVTLTVFVLGLLGRGSRIGRLVATMADRPAQLMALSFGVSALFGGFLLTLPLSLRDTSKASFVDGLFTATSAVCVTGLSVNEVSVAYSLFGQSVILLLIQVGGLGIMVLSAFFSIAAGRRLRARSSAVLAEMIDADSVATLRRTLRNIMLFTVSIEAIGAVALYAGLLGHPEALLGPESKHPAAGAGGAAWWAVFHSVSAFCNAGFSLSRGNLTAFAASWPVCVTICTLVTAGGLGFPVLEEILARLRARLAGRRPEKASLQLRVTLAYSALLTGGGAAMFLVLEWGRTLAPLGTGGRFLASIFQSVAARTAGFNTIDLGAAAPATLLFVSFLMFVGASSGSTGGGIKTSTFAVLLATFRSELRGQSEPRLFDRRLSQQTVRRAVAVAVVSVGLVALVTFVLLLTEEQTPIALLFETVSALSTTGLSAGGTAALSVVGKLVVVAAMFVGRTGPLTLALAVASAAQRPRFTVPEGRLPIG